MLVHKITWEKKWKKTHIKLKNLKAIFLKLFFWHIVPFFYKFDTTLSNQFFLNYFLVLYLKLKTV